ncbi:MAG: SAM-dependent methyltransferase [Ignavibacteria bacterium]|nr:MAG: SAM-dependent methyltransferase [Ignavibacteria bacterium]KAF0158547.1 MAG: SAM-dependent methyltransferase [Ignavibacteria bacterium]
MDSIKFKNYFSTQVLNIDPEIEEYIKWNKLYFLKNFKQLLPIDKTSNILELGCGFGKNLLVLESLGYKNCHGIDISQEQIEYAKNVLGLCNVEKVDIFQYLYNNSTSYNCILLIDVLEHFSDDELFKISVYLKPALKENGILIIQVPNGITIFNPIFYGDITHKRAFSTYSVRQFLKMADFDQPDFFEPNIPVNNTASFIKNVIWKLFLRPFLSLYIFISYKRMKPTILTNNLIVRVCK